MSDQLTHILFTYLAQAACAVIMAILLHYFYRIFRHAYLRHWSWSWWAFSIYLVGAIIGFSVSSLYQATHPLLVGVTIVALTGGYLQAIWLLLGIYEITTGKILARRIVGNVLLFLFSLAVVTTLAFIADPDAGAIRFFLRIGVRSLLVGAGFIYAAIGILRLGFAKIAIGQRLVAGVFLVYGLEQLQYFFSTAANLFGHEILLPYSFLFGILDFLLQALLGLGMVIWLLEDERKVVVKTSESLRKAEWKLARFRTVLDQAGEAIFVIEPEMGRFLDVNETASRMTGYTREELLKLAVKDIEVSVPVKTTEQWQEQVEKIKAAKSLVFMEGTHKRKDGSTYPVELSITFRKFEGHSYLLAVARDVSERKHTEELVFNIAKGVSAATGNMFFRSLAKHLADALHADYAFIGVYKKEPVEQVETIAVHADGEMADNITYELAGSPCENVVGQKLCCYPNSIQQLFPNDQLLVEMEVEAYAGAPLFDSNGKALGLMVVLYRQSLDNPEVAESLLKIFAVRASAELERNQTVETLRESEKRFRDLFESSPDAIFVEDLAGNVLDANPAAGQLHGLNHTELIGKNIIELVPPDKSEIATQDFQRLVKGEIDFVEGMSRALNAHDIPVEIHANHIYYAGKPALLMLVRDLTERKKAEHEKQQMEAQLRQA
ncbi:MAG: PAS domain S-box protein, partial [bacterium]